MRLTDQERSAFLARIRASHSFRGTLRGGVPACAACGAVLPCDAIRLADELEIMEDGQRIYLKVLRFVLFVLTDRTETKTDLCDDVQCSAEDVRAELDRLRAHVCPREGDPL